MKASTHAWIFALTLVLPIVWILSAPLLVALLPSNVFGSIGGVVVKNFLGSLMAVSLTCWAFVRRFRRKPAGSEIAVLFTYWGVWLLLIEVINLWGHLARVPGNMDNLESDRFYQYLGVLAVSFLLNMLFVAISFWRVGCPIIDAFLRKMKWDPEANTIYDKE